MEKIYDNSYCLENSVPKSRSKSNIQSVMKRSKKNSSINNSKSSQKQIYSKRNLMNAGQNLRIDSRVLSLKLQELKEKQFLSNKKNSLIEQNSNDNYGLLSSNTITNIKQSISTRRIDVKKQIKHYNSLTRRIEQLHVLPQTMNMRKLPQLENKPYLKMYQQKNQTHDSDREKPNSIVANIIFKKLKKNKQNLLFGLIDNDGNNEDKNLDLNLDTLVYLGQEEKGKMQDIIDQEQELQRKSSLKKLKVMIDNIKAKETDRSQLNEGQDQQALPYQSSQHLNIPTQALDENKKKRLTLREIMALQLQNKEQNQIQSSGNLQQLANNNQQSQNDQDINSNEDNSLNNVNPVVVILQIPSDEKSQILIQDQEYYQDNQDTIDSKYQQQQPQPNQLQNKVEARSESQKKFQDQVEKLKNLKYLIKTMKEIKKKKEILKKNPNLQNLNSEEAHLFQEETKLKIPPIKVVKNLPLNQKLVLIEKFNLDSNQILNSEEQKIVKLQKDMFIPQNIKIVNLKKLLHKNVTKVNKWIKTSLNGKYQHEFDYFMQNDKSLVDRNSLQYQQIIQDRQEKQQRAKKVEQSKSGYLDPNMKAIDISQKKVITDILQKYQLKNYQLLPIHDEKRDQIHLKLSDINKLQEEIIREHEAMEEKLRAIKEKKFNKWKILHQEFKKKQATVVSQGSGSISPSLPPRSNNMTIENSLSQSPRVRKESPSYQGSQSSISANERNSSLGSLSPQGSLGQNFREYLMEKLDQAKSQQLLKQLEDEVSNQKQLEKSLSKDIDEFQYYNIKRLNGETFGEYDPLLPGDLYVKNGKNKHFSKNIAVWKQQELYEDLHSDWAFTMKKFRILQGK